MADSDDISYTALYRTAIPQPDRDACGLDMHVSLRVRNPCPPAISACMRRLMSWRCMLHQLPKTAPTASRMHTSASYAPAFFRHRIIPPALTGFLSLCYATPHRNNTSRAPPTGPHNGPHLPTAPRLHRLRWLERTPHLPFASLAMVLTAKGTQSSTVSPHL